MRRPFAVVALVFLACSSSPATAVTSPSPSAAMVTPILAPSPTTSPGPTTVPSELPDLPVSNVDLSCRLPVVTNPSQANPGVTLHGGFITFPAAQLVDDPAGTMHSRDVEADFATSATPVLYGSGDIPFYDRAQSRWVPARAAQSLADGSAYAYTTWDRQTGLFTAHVVDVPSGGSRSFKLPAIWSPFVADYGAAGVYILSSSALGGPSQGVWLLDPRTGSIKRLREINSVWTVRDGYAWVARFDSRDKTVWPPSEPAPANSVVRINLATGTETVWFYRAGSYPWLLDLASSDRPVVSVGNDQGNEILVVDRSGSQGQRVYSGNLRIDHVLGDGERLWFGGSRGIYLYRPDRGLQKVFAYDADPNSSNRIEPAGFCR